MKQILLFTLACLTLVCMPRAIEGQTVIRVTPTGTGAGTSWDDPADLSEALRNVDGPTEIWVSTGSYTPKDKLAASDSEGSVTLEQHRSFLIPPGVSLYGGFAATEQAREQRDPNNNPTILSGLLEDGTHAFHVVVLALPVSGGEALLDGFHIIEGEAVGGPAVVVDGHTIPSDAGGGVFMTGAGTVSHNRLYSNSAARLGAGMYVDTNAWVEGNRFYENTSSGDGGGIYIERAKMANNLLYRNRATANGGAIATGSGAQVIHCTIYDNQARESGGGHSSRT